MKSSAIPKSHLLWRSVWECASKDLKRPPTTYTSRRIFRELRAESLKEFITIKAVLVPEILKLSDQIGFVLHFSRQ